MKKRLEEILCSITGALILSVLLWAILIAIMAITAQASGPGYNDIRQTENKTVIELTERVAEIYPICPELLQAQIFYESSNRMSARSGKCIGYMQVSTKYHGDRADKLGVSLYDGYGNILTGADYLVELCEHYGDVATALMIYNGTSDAVERGENGNLTDYAKNILELSEKLERKHGK